MPFVRRLIILALVAFVATLIYFFGFKSLAENEVESELAKLTAQIEKSNGTFTYGDPNLDGDFIKISNLAYTDSVKGMSVTIGSVNARINLKGGFDGQLLNIVVTPEGAKPIFITNASFTNLQPIQDINKADFEQITLSGISTEGKITSSKTVKLNLANIIANNAKMGTIKNLEFNGLSLGDRSKPSAFNINSFTLQDINIEALGRDLSALQNGDIPLTLLPITGASSNLSEFLAQGQTSTNADFENQVLDLFLNNAPQELKDLFNNPTAPEFREELKNFNEKSPENQLINGLELLLKGLKSQNENAQ